SRRRVGGDVEAGLPVGKVERAPTVRDGIPRTGFKEPRRTGVIGRRAGPEDALLLLDLLVRDPCIVDHASRRTAPQFVEDLARRAERESPFAAERPRDVLNDPPVLPRIA